MAALQLRRAQEADLAALLKLEETCFSTDRLSRRSFRHWLRNERCAFLVACDEDRALGYILIIFHRGTRLARLYSIATDPAHRGKGIARRLIEQGEAEAQSRGRLYLRLEVASNNHAAIGLYESLGYRCFGVYHDYYEDHADALRMQKRIRHYEGAITRTPLRWIRQTTPFTCGPAALMMAMDAIDEQYQPSLHEELQIWREATTIFMTSGHGGCHPVGLALAASKRGFKTEVWLNRQEPLFVDSVRDANKKRIIELSHEDFIEQANAFEIPLHYADITAEELAAACGRGDIPLILISTYRMDGKKAPHWVVLSGYDDDCFYVHDPDPEESSQGPLDCQYLPIARGDFERMSCFGQQRLRTTVILRTPKPSP